MNKALIRKYLDFVALLFIKKLFFLLFFSGKLFTEDNSSSPTLGIQVNFPQAKKQFLSKVHQYIKERLLDPKYACAFLLDISRSQQPEFEEVFDATWINNFYISLLYI